MKSAEQNTSKPLEWPNYGNVSVSPLLPRNSNTTSGEFMPGTPKPEKLWLALLAVVSMTTACASSTTEFVKAEPGPELTSPCPPLPLIDDVPRWILDTISAYEDCAAKHSALVEAVK